MRHIKLEEPPRTRLRVHHIAKEIGVSSQEVLEVLEEIGEYVKSSQSLVEAPIIRRVHERFGVTYASPVRSAETVEAPTSSSSPHNPRGLAAPPRRPKRDNHPLMGEISPRREREAYVDSSPATTTPPTTSWTNRRDDQQWGDLAGGDASSTFEFEEWKLRGFSDIERDVWIAAGLRAGQARWAQELRDGGLSPTDLDVDLYGWTVVVRLQHGEGAKAVARMLSQMRNLDAS